MKIKAENEMFSSSERVLKENEKINSLIKKLEEDSKERQWIQTVDDEYFAYTEKAMYADELLSFLRGEEKMNEEEKKAVEFIRDLITWDVRQYLCPNKEECKNLEIILNLIDKLQKENEELKERNEYYIPKSVIQDKIEEIINNSTFGCVGCEWNDIEVVQLLEYMLLDRRDK